jgi:hypothetical protein
LLLVVNTNPNMTGKHPSGYSGKLRAAIDMLDLGGVFVLSPRRSEIDRLADQLKADLLEQGESLESMLQALREARQRYEA